MTWITQYWYLIFGIVGGASFIVIRMRRRGGAEPFLTRLLYSIVPLLDPQSEERKSLTPRALVLFVVALAILALVILFVPGFSE